MNIDFTPTAYTVTNPGNGQQVRYDTSLWPGVVAAAQEEFYAWSKAFPSLAQFIVPDYFVQEFCRAYDSSLHGGYGGRVNADGIFLKLAEAGARQARFN
jgi:hypothetical protein